MIIVCHHSPVRYPMIICLHPFEIQPILSRYVYYYWEQNQYLTRMTLLGNTCLHHNIAPASYLIHTDLRKQMTPRLWLGKGQYQTLSSEGYFFERRQTTQRLNVILFQIHQYGQTACCYQRPLSPYLACILV